VGTQEYIAKRTGALMSHEEWRRVVGAKIASRSRLGGLYRGTLTIKVASSAWSNELSFLKADIIQRLGMAGYEVSGLRFRVDPEPFRDARQKPVHGAPRPAPAANLPPELEARLATIDDANLRAAIREAAVWSLGNPARSTSSPPGGDRGSAAGAPRPRPRR